MANMEEVLDSIYRVVYRWSRTTSQLSASTTVGLNTVTVESSIRFQPGDEVTIHNNIKGEVGLVVDSIPDNNTIKFTKPVEFFWNSNIDTVFVEKTINNRFVKHIFIGEPQVIGSHQLPAIVIMGNTKESKWFTIGTTKEKYDLQIGIYVEDSTLEEGYRFLLKMTDTIDRGLKKNIFPLVGDFTTHNIIFDVNSTDAFIKVDSTVGLVEGQRIIIENLFTVEELNICNIVDSQTINIQPVVNKSYKVSDNAKVIGLKRFIFNSWPATIDYGYKHKGTLMKASVISWFAEEQEVQTRHGWSDPQLS